jgi:hypothetical protein
MSGHTPGPWTVNECSHGGGLLRRGDQVGPGTHPQSSLQVTPMADAVLISAAPDLLAALREIAVDILPEFLRDHPGSYRAVQSLHAAIAKAEGR